MSAEHTAEPWAAGVTVIDGKQYFAVAEAKNTKRVLALCGAVGASDEDESIANARRIAASINALQHLGQDHLDNGWDWLGQGKAIAEYANEIDRLKAANAELAAALQDVIGWVPGRSAFHTDEPSKAVSRARAMLEKHKGEAV